MSLGELQCIGSTQFLKSTFGAGYNLIFDKLPTATPTQVQELTTFIQTHLPDAVLHSSPETNAMEIQLQYTLPFDSVTKFGQFFLELENNLSHFCVSKYGITITSLEDVFLKVPPCLSTPFCPV
jgi:ATP-binding cassette, subfamily A (ABC1), member 3